MPLECFVQICRYLISLYGIALLRLMIFILPFLLKSFQFISMLSQRGLQVQVASIMGQLKGTVVRLKRRRGQESDTDPMWTQPECQTQRQLWSETTESQYMHVSTQAGQGKRGIIQIRGHLAAWCLLSVSSPCPTAYQHTRWFYRGMICLGWPVISWLWSRRWGMHLINLPRWPLNYRY